MASFKSWRSYSKFKHTVQKRTRYIYDDETNDFLDTVLATGLKRKVTLPAEQFTLACATRT